ncbi:MAG: hypothetical protein GY937_04330 [bacterium]|nr:hypothetical protein [bacterium]
MDQTDGQERLPEVLERLERSSGRGLDRCIETAAALQAWRLDNGLTKTAGVTRTVALIAAGEFDPDLREALASAKLDWSLLHDAAGLATFPDVAKRAVDLPLHVELIYALERFADARASRRSGSSSTAERRGNPRRGGIPSRGKSGRGRRSTSSCSPGSTPGNTSRPATSRLASPRRP